MTYVKFTVFLPVAGVPAEPSYAVYPQDDLPEAFLRNELTDLIEETAENYSDLFNFLYSDSDEEEYDEEELWDDFLTRFGGNYKIISEDEFLKSIE